MTADGVLALILAAADDRGRVFDHHDLSEWPPGALESLRRLGVLQAAAGGLWAACPGCADRHVEVVGHHAGPDGSQRLFVYCPQELRVEVTPAMCGGWEVHPAGLAAAVAGAINPRGAASEQVPGRLWRVGAVTVSGVRRRVVLARCMHEADAASIANQIGVGGRQVVLVPHHVPDPRVWPGHVPAVIPLTEVASIESGELRLDAELVVTLIGDADADAEARSPLPVDPQVKSQVVRRQVKAEIKGHLTDDVLVGVYRMHGSLRRAAAALTAQLGRPVSKDQVQRAVARAGGPWALVDPDDSASVARTVASRSCDRSKKILQRR